MSYLTTDEAETHLEDRYEIITTLTAGRLDAASWELDASGPFIGGKLDSSGAQELAFPRNINPDGTTNEEEGPPEVVLDRVALIAYKLTSGAAVSSPAITSESIGNTSRSYASPKLSEVDTLLEANWNAFYPYLLKSGQRVETGSITYRTHESYPDWPIG